jgi:sortase A
MRFVERLLLLIGILALGSYAYAYLDTRFYEYRQTRLLEQSLADGGAQETDSLNTFRGEEDETPPGPPLEDGALIGRIEAPRVGVSALVLEGVANRTLRRGAGHIPETPLPSRRGNVGIAAHRDSFFRGLKDIRKNDIISLETPFGTYQYEVQWTRVVDPDDTHVLDETEEPALTLVTCYPFYYVGSAPKRFIVRAQRIEDTRSGG